VTEAELLNAVKQCALLFNWRFYHPWMSVKSARGFPDCCMVRGDRLIFAELKSARGRTTEAQLAWLLDLKRTGAETFVWRPEHWLTGEIERTLR
jgi:hypothetical protein